METRAINDRYAEIAAELIENEPVLEYIKNSDVQIIFLSSDQKKKSKGDLVHGQCERVPDKYKWGIPADFTITIFEPNIDYYNEQQLKILLLHELLHVGIDADKMYCRNHDLSDFKYIIDNFGTEWSEPKNEN